MAFHADAALTAILDSIEVLIERECIKQNVKLPKGPKTTNRPPSWNWLELLDRKAILGEKKFNDGDRSKIIEASRESERYGKQLPKLIKQVYLNNLEE